MLVASALISGLGLGSMYGLLALGFHVTYAVSNTVNFAQGSMMGMKRGGAVLAVVVIAAIVWIVTGDGYRLYVIAMVGLTAIVGIGLNVLIGLTGQISLGHVGFYAIGAYAVGILTTTASWSFWASLLAAGTITGAAGVLLAVPALRVRGPYLAMVTIAFGFVAEQGAAEWSGLTGGWNGLSEIF